MTTNQEHQQATIADQLAEHARTLAHSTRTIPNPPDSYTLIGNLAATIDHLEQVTNQLATWHHNTQHGEHHQGEDPHGKEDTQTTGTPATTRTTQELQQAAQALQAASTHLHKAHTTNGTIRWNPNTLG